MTCYIAIDTTGKPYFVACLTENIERDADYPYRLIARVVLNDPDVDPEDVDFDLYRFDMPYSGVECVVKLPEV